MVASNRRSNKRNVASGALPAGKPARQLETTAERAVAAGVIGELEALALARHRELVDKVVRVDDFAPDLGASECVPRPLADTIALVSGIKLQSMAA